METWHPPLALWPGLGVRRPQCPHGGVSVSRAFSWDQAQWCSHGVESLLAQGVGHVLHVARVLALDLCQTKATPPGPSLRRTGRCLPAL